MHGHTSSPPGLADTESDDAPRVKCRLPRLEDGATMWRIARDSQTLDLNTAYSYLLWCRDFAGSSVVAEVDGEPGGFVTGYVRPDQPDTVMVWQVAVDAAHRGQMLARRMLDSLADRLADQSVCRMECTITADNEASIRLFSSFATARGAAVERELVFPGELFPDGHDAEVLFRIGPW
ncbi:MAG: diaminobutyrate acetyltransferase [Nocardioidaceae bacterium]